MKIRDIGEFGLIDEINKMIGPGLATIIGIGDDAAVLRGAREGICSLFTTDMLVEGTHFDLSTAPPYGIGWKAVGCCLSDIAAMGGVPLAATLAMGAPGNLELEFCRELYRGAKDLAGRFHCDIVGGDTVGSARGLVISVAMLGEVEGERLALRSGAEIGDSVWVTGALGGSISERHLSFTPRVEEARYLVEHFPVKAMMDISDGLGSDIHRMAAASGVGFRIFAEHVPVNRKALGDLDEETAVERALYDGEDFELLLAIDGSCQDELLRSDFSSRFDCGISRVGVAVGRDTGVTLVRRGREEPLKEKGFSHFG